MSRRPQVAAKRRKNAAPPVAGRHPLLEPVGLALILLTAFLVYLPALTGGVLWDDAGHITRPALQSIGGLYSIWFDVGATQQYYPFLHTAFWLEHKLWGDAVLGYHLVNVAWHLLAVALVYAILTKLKIPGALLAAAIFALHPVMVESVAWITEQKNTLSAVFYLSAMLLYLTFDESRRRSQYLIALGLFVLGLFTKTVTATLPAALLVIFWWQRGTLSWQRDIRPLLPFFLLGAAAGVLTAWFERTLIGAEGAGYEMSFVERCLLAGRVVWFYLSKLVWPANLVFIYPRWTIDPAVWWQWLFPAATLGVLVALWALRRKARGPLAGWLLFVGTLFPVLGFLNVFPFIFSYVADHFLYLAGLGMIALAAAAIAQGVARLAQPARRIGTALCVLLVGTLAVLSWRQTHMYADNVTLYQTTLDRNPACWMAHNNLGELVAASNRDDAIAHYESALRLRPDYPEAHNNLGYELTKLNQFQQAIDHLVRAVQIKPDYATAHNNLGIALFSMGQIPQATEQFRLALQFNANDANAHSNLANILSRAGDVEQAIAHYQEAVRIRPDFVEVHYRLAEVLRQIGQLQQAIDHYQAALRYQPAFVDVYVDLVPVLASVDQSKEAIATAQKGIEVARSAGRQAAAEQLEEWLKHYRAELQRADAAPVSQPPSPAHEPTQSK